MKAIRIVFLCMLWLQSVVVFAQEPIAIYDNSQVYNEALSLFDHEKYAASMERFDDYIALQKDPQHALRINAEYYRGICKLYLQQRDAEFELERFVREHPDSPWKGHAYFELATFNYKSKNYRKAIEWFGEVDPTELSDAQKIEFYYKRGHSLFETDKKKEARQDFFEVIQVESQYKQAALYYYSHIAYEQNDLETALDGFKKLENDPNFSPVVPYYITQIYYKQKKYDELLAYAPAVLDSAKTNTTKRVPEIARLIGDAYFIKEKYVESLPYLEQYHQGTPKNEISREDFYELGYAYYRTSKFEKALEAFSNCSGENDELYQLATYNMADCYLKLDKKEYARNAFGEAAAMEFNREIQEDALFNYSKLAFELSYNPFHEAITAFEDYLNKYPDSPRRDEAYEFLLNVYMKTRNYEKALASLDKIKNKDNRVKEAYQVVAYNRGVELFQSEDFDNSEKFFDKVSTYTVNPMLNTDAKFWKAEISYRLKDYNKAIQRYNAFLSEQGAVGSEFYGLANYGIGYCYFKLANDEDNIETMRGLYNNANTGFRKYADGNGVKDPKKVNDANLRIGDCFYVNKSYAQAIQYYDKVADNSQGNKDYAMFQKGMCYGFDGQADKKSWVLKNLLADIPDTKFKIDAKYELASTYLLSDRLSEAKTYYQDIIKNHAASAYHKRALADMCLIYVREGNVGAVKETWNTLFAAYPNDPILKDAVSTVQSTLIEDPEFQQQIRGIKIIDIKDSDIEKQVYDKAISYAYDGNCEVAIEKLTAYLQQFQPATFGAEAHYYLANCYFDKGETDKALNSYNYVINEPFNDYTEDALKVAATINYNKKNYQVAADHYTELEQVAVQKLNVLEAQIGLMRCHYFLGNKDLAATYADKVVLNANTPDDIKTTGFLWRGRIRMDNNDDAGATLDFKEVMKKGGANAAEAKYHIAFMYYRSGQYEKAEEELFQHIEKYSAFAEWKYKAFLLLADVYVGMKDYFQARTTLDQILERVQEQWVRDEATRKLAALDALENPDQGGSRSGEEEINLVPEEQN
jgi:tetratricopeptide (TPR) repeat protein